VETGLARLRRAPQAAFVELKLALARFLRNVRVQQGWTQAQTAKRLGSSQSRFAKMEAADASVSVDLLVKSLLRVGAGRPGNRSSGTGRLACAAGEIQPIRARPALPAEVYAFADI
jgi:transcriptional regulator with XRE-family HTH domain